MTFSHGRQFFKTQRVARRARTPPWVGGLEGDLWRPMASNGRGVSGLGSGSSSGSGTRSVSGSGHFDVFDWRCPGQRRCPFTWRVMPIQQQQQKEKNARRHSEKLFWKKCKEFCKSLLRYLILENLLTQILAHISLKVKNTAGQKFKKK